MPSWHGHTRITGEKNGLEASLLAFVPLNYDGEINHLTLTNHSQETKAIDLFSLREWCLWDASDDMLNFQRNYLIGKGEVGDNTIYHKTEYPERRNHYAFYSVNSPIDGFDSQLEDFLGPHNGFHVPQAVLSGRVANSFTAGWQPCASHHIKLSLTPPDEMRTFIFILGYVELPVEEKWEKPHVINKRPAKAMIERYQTDAR